MTKKDFLQKLKEYLSYELPREYVEKEYKYYSSYISDEVKNGRSEAEVLEDLGDPQLIAHSIIDAARSGSDGIPGTEDDVDFYGEIYDRGGSEDSGAKTAGAAGAFGGGTSGGYGSGKGQAYGYGSGKSYGGGSSGDGGRGFYYVGGCLPLVLVFIFFLFIISFIGGLLGLLGPVLVPLCMVFLIFWLLDRRR